MRIAAMVVAPTIVAASGPRGGAGHEHAHSREKLPGDLGDLQPEQIPNLRAGDQDADAIGEPDDDWPRDVFDRGAEAGDPEKDQDDAGHQRAHEQSVDAVCGHDARHHDDESAGRTADLDAGTAEGRDRESRDDRAVDAVLRR